MTKQNLDEGGVILFKPIEGGSLVPGRFIEQYISILCPKNNYLFQKPLYGKKFEKKIHKNGLKIFYCDSKVGHSHVGKMMPKVIITYLIYLSFCCTGPLWLLLYILALILVCYCEYSWHFGTTTRAITSPSRWCSPCSDIHPGIPC